MNNIIKSASKIAFLTLIGTASLAFAFEVVVGTAVLSEDNFMILAAGASAFYFANKGNSGEEYLGK